jgi:uncharacterized membrane protein YwzB
MDKAVRFWALQQQYFNFCAAIIKKSTAGDSEIFMIVLHAFCDAMEEFFRKSEDDFKKSFILAIEAELEILQQAFAEVEQL